MVKKMGTIFEKNMNRQPLFPPDDLKQETP